MPQQMLVAIRSGIVLDSITGDLVEITAGVTRIAPEVLRRDPDYRDYFDPAVTAHGSDATRSVTRVRAPIDPSTQDDASRSAPPVLVSYHRRRAALARKRRHRRA